MSGEITKQPVHLSAIQALRALRTLDGEDQLSILKTAVKDGKGGLALRGLSLIQRWNEGRFWDAFLAEAQAMLDAGRIREDFDHTDAGVSSVQEFFELVDGKPDKARFQAFCALFMSVNAPEADENEAIVDLELMSILRDLSAGEMHLLSALIKMGFYQVGDDLIASVSKELGYRSESLVNKNIQSLFKHSLIDKTNWENRGGTGRQRKELLTDLGMELAKRVRTYGEFKERQEGATSAT
jgi:hypothetical protein